jgi:hypothetical protein
MPMNSRLLRPLATGFNLKSIANLALWLDAQDGATLFDAQSGGSLVAADGSVGRWVDKSGGGRNVTQGTANNRPVLKTGIVNGRNVLRFNGTSHILFGADTTSDLPFPYSLFAVYQSSDTAGSIVSSTRTSGGFVAEVIRKSAANTLQGLQQNGSTNGEATVAAADASWHVAEIVYSGTASSLTFTVRANGGTTSDMTTARARDASAATRALNIGGVISGGGFIDGLQGDIAEVVAYGRTLSAAELSRVRQYLGKRYGITVT